MYANHPPGPDPWTAALAALAGIVLFGLLIAFVQVVRAGVAQGDLRRRTVAEDAQAVWRCNALPGSVNREACAARLKLAHATIDSRRP